MSDKRYHFTLIGGGQFSTIGGIVRSMAEIANDMVERGHSVHIVARGEEGDEPFFKLDPRVTLDWKKYPYGVGAIDEFRAYLETLETDVMCLLFSNRMGLNMAVAAKDLPVPVLRSEHGNPVHIVETIWENNTAVRDLTFQLADVSHILMQDFADLPPLPESVKSSLAIIPSPIKLDVPQAMPAGVPGQRKRVLYAGRIEEYEKNAAGLLAAFTELAPDFPDWELHYFGDGGLREDLEALAEESQVIGDQVIFHGSIPPSELSGEFAKAQIFVIPSDTEGCPISLGEAMAHGLPCIGFADCAGVNAMIEDGVTGRLAATDLDPRAQGLVEPLRELMEDALKRIEMGRNSAEAIKPFGDETVYDAWEALLVRTAELKPHLSEYRAQRRETFPDLSEAEKLLGPTMQKLRKERTIEPGPGIVGKIDKPAPLAAPVIPQSFMPDAPQPVARGEDGKTYPMKGREIVVPATGAPDMRKHKKGIGEPLVSIIVPVYNKEDVLLETLQSALGQTMRRIEVIAVNDGSQDGSQKILDTVAASDDRLKAYHRENAGVSAARNFGLSEAKGRYILFWDADDVLEKDACEKLFIAAEKTGADISVGALYLFNNNNRVEWVTPKYWLMHQSGSLAPTLTSIRDCQVLRYDVSACNKLYRRSFLNENDYKFPEGFRLEDIYFSWLTHMTSGKAVISPVYVGGYRKFFGGQHAPTGSQTWSPLKVQSTLHVYNLLLDLISGEPTDISKALRQDIDVYFLSVFVEAVRTSLELSAEHDEAAEWLSGLQTALKDMDEDLILTLPLESASLLMGLRNAEIGVSVDDLKAAIETATHNPRRPSKELDLEALPLEQIVRIMESYPTRKRLDRQAPPADVARYYARQSLLLSRHYEVPAG